MMNIFSWLLNQMDSEEVRGHSSLAPCHPVPGQQWRDVSWASPLVTGSLNVLSRGIFHVACSHWLPNTLITHLLCPRHHSVSLIPPTEVPDPPVTSHILHHPASRLTLHSPKIPDPDPQMPLFITVKTQEQPKGPPTGGERQAEAQPHCGAAQRNKPLLHLTNRSIPRAGRKKPGSKANYTTA